MEFIRTNELADLHFSILSGEMSSTNLALSRKYFELKTPDHAILQSCSFCAVILIKSAACKHQEIFLQLRNCRVHGNMEEVPCV